MLGASVGELGGDGSVSPRNLNRFEVGRDGVRHWEMPGGFGGFSTVRISSNLPRGTVRGIVGAPLSPRSVIHAERVVRHGLFLRSVGAPASLPAVGAAIREVDGLAGSEGRFRQTEIRRREDFDDRLSVSRRDDAAQLKARRWAEDFLVTLRRKKEDLQRELGRIRADTCVEDLAQDEVERVWEDRTAANKRMERLRLHRMDQRSQLATVLTAANVGPATIFVSPGIPQGDPIGDIHSQLLPKDGAGAAE